ncbi:hypothetical protein AvCA_51380 [Azotobacter vinelandii CA]|uniref:Uncharacterized protein n=2 Tax=Azotobacter vinelandii TaxID=354 RepID=C1DMD9_AZOVD|nr:hypothetical protein Avin_51380 [Azotobacter vinelandii DJ]AGK15766.1 hypothetical protein AvCA_51380 [Azotobacter vinelandii CA]AGK22404.1 hypothetical protein AvCA6_51380 [Azotobacter vinelandii CA6]GLK59233.1 hypothetical protein GCM10017624_13900 [Azotobacter vinelandii]
MARTGSGAQGFRSWEMKGFYPRPRVFTGVQKPDVGKGQRVGMEERVRTASLGRAQIARAWTREEKRENSDDKDGQYSMSVNLLIFIRSPEGVFLRLISR